MKINYKKTTKILLFVVAYDTVVSAWNRHVVHPLNVKKFDQLRKERDDARRLSDYFAAKLDEHNIPVEPFDQIIIDNLTPTKK
jgi:hypothetical protein